MGMIDSLILELDSMLDTKRKRHLVGGILLSVSFLFAGLAVTVFTIGNDDEDL